MDAITTLPATVIETLGAGMPVLSVQLGATLALLLAGTWLYKRVSPFDDDAQIEVGNAAAGILLAGSILAIAIPLAAALAAHRSTLDILIWGTVALAIQLVTAFILISRPRVRSGIVAGNVSMAVATAGGQLAVSALNAGAMLG